MKLFDWGKMFVFSYFQRHMPRKDSKNSRTFLTGNACTVNQRGARECLRQRGSKIQKMKIKLPIAALPESANKDRNEDYNTKDTAIKYNVKIPMKDAHVQVDTITSVKVDGKDAFVQVDTQDAEVKDNLKGSDVQNEKKEIYVKNNMKEDYVKDVRGAGLRNSEAKNNLKFSDDMKGDMKDEDVQAFVNDVLKSVLTSILMGSDMKGIVKKETKDADVQVEMREADLKVLMKDVDVQVNMEDPDVKENYVNDDDVTVYVNDVLKCVLKSILKDTMKEYLKKSVKVYMKDADVQVSMMETDVKADMKDADIQVSMKDPNVNVYNTKDANLQVNMKESNVEINVKDADIQADMNYADMKDPEVTEHFEDEVEDDIMQNCVKVYVNDILNRSVESILRKSDMMVDMKGDDVRDNMKNDVVKNDMIESNLKYIAKTIDIPITMKDAGVVIVKDVLEDSEGEENGMKSFVKDYVYDILNASLRNVLKVKMEDADAQVNMEDDKEDQLNDDKNDYQSDVKEDIKDEKDNMKDDTKDVHVQVDLNISQVEKVDVKTGPSYVKMPNKKKRVKHPEINNIILINKLVVAGKESFPDIRKRDVPTHKERKSQKKPNPKVYPGLLKTEKADVHPHVHWTQEKAGTKADRNKPYVKSAHASTDVRKPYVKKHEKRTSDVRTSDMRTPDVRTLDVNVDVTTDLKTQSVTIKKPEKRKPYVKRPAVNTDGKKPYVKRPD